MTAPSKAVVIGDIEVARRTCSALLERGYKVEHLLQPTDAELREALTPEVAAVAVLIRGDVIALRYALLVEHLKPQVRLVVTLFDRTVAEQLIKAVPNCQVTSPADISVPSIIGGCLGDSILAVEVSAAGAIAIVSDGDDARSEVWHNTRSRFRQFLSAVAGQARAHDESTRLLFIGLAGLVTTLFLDWFLATTALHEKGIRALYIAARIVATVGPGDADLHAPSWYLVLASVFMLATIVFTAMFTAGVVNRALSSRSIGIVGARTIPTRDHVAVVGLGPVGLRLCTQLRQLGIKVIAVERDPRAVNLRLAKAAQVPVLIAHAEDRAVLKRLSLHRARALAAMGADDLDNIEVAIAALAVAPDVRIVLRAGEDDVIAETRSLFTIGQVRDVSALTAFAVTASLAGEAVQTVYLRGNHVAARCACG